MRSEIGVVWFLTGVLFLQYVDRPLIGGLATSLMAESGLDISSKEVGFLQSAFVVGFVVGSVYFTQRLSNREGDKFKVLFWSLILWEFAIFLCVISGFLDSYFILLIGRILSGIGEASLSVSSMPLFEDTLKEEEKGFYVGVYYSSIPIGLAAGYAWAGSINEMFDHQWQYVFLLEMPFMLPFIYLSHSYSLMDDFNTRQDSEDRLLDVKTERVLLASNPIDDAKRCLSNKLFMTICLSYTVFNGVLGGLSFFVPVFMQSNEPADPAWAFLHDEKTADLVFGMMTLFAGIFGTLLGGCILSKCSGSVESLVDGALKQVVLQSAAGTSLALVGLFAPTPTGFIICCFLAILCYCMCNPVFSLLCVWSVDEDLKTMGSGMSNVLIHLFGDVPSPVIIGILNDNISSWMTMFLSVSSMVFCVLFLAVAYRL